MRLLSIVVFACAFARPVSAQLYETVGIRAQGMAGAFVAVADDSTATWWNPAGLASGAYFSGSIEHRTGEGIYDEGTLGVSLMVPSLGLSYYRVRVGAVQPSSSTVPTGEAGQDQDAGIRSLTFSLTQFGVTTGQSLGEHLVVASTAKLVRADQTRGDLDLGALAKAGSIRLGISARNMFAPDLTVDGNPIEHKRQVRVGAAVFTSSRRGVSLVAAVDADLTTTATAGGEARHVAGGGEVRAGRLGLRGGVSVNSIGEVRSSYSGGASLAIRQGMFLDAHLTRGDDDAMKAWGFALRVTY
ncbi:MAG: hypothetical protein ABI868_18635 [Acidobacteriota bacterium]